MESLKLIEGENRIRCERMWRYFIDNCPDAEGSSFNHQAWKGGYFSHINDIIEYGLILYESLSKVGPLTFKISDVILVLFLHDIEKPIKYSKILNSSISHMSSVEIRSILIDQYEIELNEEQLNALKYVHGEGDDYTNKERIMNPLAAFCHCCDVISARIFFDRVK